MRTKVILKFLTPTLSVSEIFNNVILIIENWRVKIESFYLGAQKVKKEKRVHPLSKRVSGALC